MFQFLTSCSGWKHFLVFWSLSLKQRADRQEVLQTEPDYKTAVISHKVSTLSCFEGNVKAVNSMGVKGQLTDGTKGHVQNFDM